MRIRVLLAALAAGALLAAPVAGADAKPKQDGDGGAAKSKKCEKTKQVGFKVKGTLLAGSDLSTIDMTVSHANRHAREWLAENAPSFELLDFLVNDEGDENIKFIGVADNNGDAAVDFEDATVDFGDALGVEFRVKLKGKLELLKHGCEDAVEDAVLEEDAVPEVEVRKVKVKATETD
jgi:hypothetical protein